MDTGGLYPFMQSMIGICWGVRRVGIPSTDRTYPTLVPFPLSLRFAQKFSSIFALASRIYALVFLVTILSLAIYSLSIFRSRKKHLPFFNPIGNKGQTSVGTSAVLTIFRPRRKHRANFSGNLHCISYSSDLLGTTEQTSVGISTASALFPIP